MLRSEADRSTLPAPLVETTDAAAARRDLRAQIARLETELGELFASGAPLAPTTRRSGSRLLTLSELERVRDELAERASAMRRALDEQGQAEQDARRAVEQMLLDPSQERWLRVPREAIGERGCGGWHARPRFGLLGMLMNWWRVVVSSGCPLASPPP